MAPDPTARLAQLLNAATIDDDQEVYHVASAAVKANRSNMDAHHTRIVALLKLDRFADALRALDEAGSQALERCQLERAYALYKMGDLGQALDIVQALLSSTQHAPQRGARHLAAQVAYKSEKFSIAADQYLSLVADRRPDEDVDIAVNTLATHAQLEWQQLARPSDFALSSPVPDSFEAVFNQGCYALAEGRLDDAVDIIGRSAAMCLASDLSDDDKRAEMIPILMQQVYVCIRLNRLDQAVETLKSIDTKDTDEYIATFRHINNLVLHQGETANPFMTQRALTTLPEIPFDDKIFGYQTWRIECARHVADLQSRRYAGVARSISKKLEREFLPNASCRISSLSAVRAAAEADMQSGKPAIRKLTPLIASRPDDIGLLLTVVQLYTSIQNYGAALLLVEDFGKRMQAKKDEGAGDRFRYLPGLVALRVALLQKQGRQSAARAELAKAAAFWIENVGGVGARSLLLEAGIQLIHSFNPNDLVTAGAAFEKLAKDTGSDKVAEAGFVASVATTDYSQVEPYIADLESVDPLVDQIDIDALLEGGVVSFPSQLEKQRKKRAAEEVPVKPSKKRRFRKLPKGYVEGKEMDTERWLPLRDRSTYKPKGKKGKKKALEATQGGPVKGDLGEVLELVGGAGAVKVERAAGSGNKKKKKGKK